MCTVDGAVVCTVNGGQQAVVTTAARGQWKVRVGPDWVESLTLSTVTVAPSGERRSPVSRALVAPLVEYERQAQRDAAPRIARHEARHKMQADRVDKLRRVAAASATQVDEEMCLQAAEALAEDTVERTPRWITDDCHP